MTIYEKNIQTLSKYYPGMDYNIDKAKHDLKQWIPDMDLLSP